MGVGGGGGICCQTFILFSFPCSADQERDWPPCKVVFSGLATNTLNVRNNNNINNNNNAEYGGDRRHHLRVLTHRLSLDSRYGDEAKRRAHDHDHAHHFPDLLGRLRDDAGIVSVKHALLGCGSFVRGRKRKKGDSIPFILSRRDYMPRLPDEATR